MITLGSRKRLCIGGWVLAAFIFLGYNGFVLASLFSPPLVGRSKETRLASQKWLRLEKKNSLIMKENIDNIDLKSIVSRLTPDLSVVKKRFSQPQVETREFEGKFEIKPPVLTGIMKILDAQGNLRSFALIEGKRLMEKDSVRGFNVQKVTNKGVVLTKRKKTWFIPTPKVYFSLDQGM
jgi:hypothetical protein